MLILSLLRCRQISSFNNGLQGLFKMQTWASQRHPFWAFHIELGSIKLYSNRDQNGNLFFFFLFTILRWWYTEIIGGNKYVYRLYKEIPLLAKLENSTKNFGTPPSNHILLQCFGFHEWIHGENRLQNETNHMSQFLNNSYP